MRLHHNDAIIVVLTGRHVNVIWLCKVISGLYIIIVEMKGTEMAVEVKQMEKGGVES